MTAAPASCLIRPAVAADLTEIVTIEREAETAPHWGQAEYQRIMAGTGAVSRCLLVAEWADSIAGFAVGKVAGGVGEIESVAVRPAVRRHGCGRALLKSVTAWCRLNHAETIELEARAGSTGALQLYRSLGFVEVGRRRNYYIDPAEDAVLMCLSTPISGDFSNLSRA